LRTFNQLEKAYDAEGDKKEEERQKRQDVDERDKKRHKKEKCNYPEASKSSHITDLSRVPKGT
jgi:hypothetical protein